MREPAVRKGGNYPFLNVTLCIKSIVAAPLWKFLGSKSARSAISFGRQSGVTLPNPLPFTQSGPGPREPRPGLAPRGGTVARLRLAARPAAGWPQPDNSSSFSLHTQAQISQGHHFHDHVSLMDGERFDRIYWMFGSLLHNRRQNYKFVQQIRDSVDLLGSSAQNLASINFHTSKRIIRSKILHENLKRWRKDRVTKHGRIYHKLVKDMVHLGIGDVHGSCILAEIGLTYPLNAEIMLQMVGFWGQEYKFSHW